MKAPPVKPAGLFHFIAAESVLKQVSRADVSLREY
jgi:hypothetical protein